MIDVFAVVAEPSRRRILDELSTRDVMLVGELVVVTGLTQSNVSKHLRVLRQSSMVHEVTEGKARRYHLDPQSLQPLDAWLVPYRRKWTTAMDALETHLDENQ